MSSYDLKRDALDMAVRAAQEGSRRMPGAPAAPDEIVEMAEKFERFLRNDNFAEVH